MTFDLRTIKLTGFVAPGPKNVHAKNGINIKGFKGDMGSKDTPLKPVPLPSIVKKLKFKLLL